MKFTCDRCGKRFSSVDEPVPGRVYRIRCRCGNAIQITAPHLMPEAVPRRKGGMPLREPEGAPPPPLPAGPRSATPAGDAGAPVRHGGTSSRIPAAAPREPDPFRPSASSATFAANAPQHPQATPASVLVPDAGGRIIPEPAAARTGAGSRSLPPPVLPGSSASSVSIPGQARPRARPPVEPLEGLFVQDDPFAAAAAHAAKTEPAAPAFPPARATSPAPRRKDGPSPEELSAEILVPHRTETALGLAASEQYPLAKKKKKRSWGLGKLVFGAAAAVLLVLGGAGASYVWKLLGASPPVSVAATRARSPVAPPAASAPSIPPPSEPKAATSAVPPPAPPPAAAAVPQPPAVPPPAPPVVATPAPPVETPKPAAPARLSAAERREAARKAAAERRAEAARRAEAERLSKAERKAEAERRAEADRRAEAERKAEAARKADADRAAQARADADRAAQAEAARRAEAARKAEADRAAQAQAARKAEPARVAQADRNAVATKSQPLPEGLDPAEMQAVIRANRAALEACVEKALADPATAAWAGRKISFIILVGPNGRAEAALEDSDLDASAFGTCLRRAAARMSFPAFRGEPVGARIPLVLGRG